jgi:DNA-binding protein HU-beta
MRTAQLADAVAARADLEPAAARRALDAALEVICEQLGAGGEVALTGFGRFHVGVRGGRRAADPRTGRPIDVPTVVVPRFTAGTRLKAAVRA